MKKLHFLFILLTICFQTLAQDIITKKDGNEINAKVDEVGLETIKYKDYDNINGPTYVVKKSDVFMIKYENGKKELFTEFKEDKEISYTKNTEEMAENMQDMFRKGESDAKTYYKGHSGAATGTALTTLLASGLIGLIPAIATSSTPPQDENLNYPNRQLMTDLDYSSGYRQKAKSIKSKKVWAAWGVSVALNAAVFLFIFNN